MTVYYVDSAATGTGDGLSEVNAFTAIDTAMNNVAAGDRVWVKASANYNELVTIDTIGSTSNSIRFTGYTSIPGDQGKVTIDAQSTRSYAMQDNALSTSIYYIFENFIFTNATIMGVDLNNSDVCQFINCEFTNNGTVGLFGDNDIKCMNCVFSGNGQHGIEVDSDCTFFGCVFANNGQREESLSGLFYRCVFYGGVASQSGTYQPIVILGCTFDGEGGSGHLIEQPNGKANCADNILHDTTGSGLGTTSDPYAATVLYHNYFSNCASNYAVTSNGLPYAGYLGESTYDIIDAAGFTNEAGDDYRLSQNSAALNAGIKPGGIT